MPDIPNVPKATDRLISALNNGGFEYAIVGGLAVVLHGYDRYTRDIDALVWDVDERLDELVTLLMNHGFRPASPNQVVMAPSARILHLLADDETLVDIFLGFLPFEREVIDHAVAMPIGGSDKVKVTSVEDLIIMKLIASRTRDLNDVTALLELHPDVDKDRIRQIVTEYAEILQQPDMLTNLADRLG